jgi:hypothetical protein
VVQTICAVVLRRNRPSPAYLKAFGNTPNFDSHLASRLGRRRFAPKAELVKNNRSPVVTDAPSMPFESP